MTFLRLQQLPPAVQAQVDTNLVSHASRTSAHDNAEAHNTATPKVVGTSDTLSLAGLSSGFDYDLQAAILASFEELKRQALSEMDRIERQFESDTRQALDESRFEFEMNQAIGKSLEESKLAQKTLRQVGETVARAGEPTSDTFDQVGKKRGGALEKRAGAALSTNFSSVSKDRHKTLSVSSTQGGASGSRKRKRESSLRENNPAPLSCVTRGQRQRRSRAVAQLVEIAFLQRILCMVKHFRQPANRITQSRTSSVAAGPMCPPATPPSARRKTNGCRHVESVERQRPRRPLPPRVRQEIQEILVEKASSLVRQLQIVAPHSDISDNRQQDATEFRQAIVEVLDSDLLLHTQDHVGDEVREKREHDRIQITVNDANNDTATGVAEQLAKELGESSAEEVRVERGGHPSTVKKYMTLDSSRSATLPVVVNRAGIDGARPYKKKGALELGDEKIQVPVAEGRQAWVRLRSVDVHYGRATTSGHYEAYVRRGEQWYHVNDSQTRRVGFAEVKRVAKGGGTLLQYAIEESPVSEQAMDRELIRRLLDNNDESPIGFTNNTGVACFRNTALTTMLHNGDFLFSLFRNESEINSAASTPDSDPVVRERQKAKKQLLDLALTYWGRNPLAVSLPTV